MEPLTRRELAWLQRLVQERPAQRVLSVVAGLLSDERAIGRRKGSLVTYAEPDFAAADALLRSMGEVPTASPLNPALPGEEPEAGIAAPALHIADERTVGPVAGRYVCAAAVRSGPWFLGRFRIRSEPAAFEAPGWDYEDASIHAVGTLALALEQAIDAGLRAAGRLEPQAGTSLAQPAPLTCLSYVSRASRPLSPGELQYLVERARRRNEMLGVTGCLLYLESEFMQYIEGPGPQLELVYHHIRRDAAHTGLIELSREPIAQRAFPTWTLAFDTPGAGRWPGAGPVPAWPQGLQHGETVRALLAAFMRRPVARPR